MKQAQVLTERDIKLVLTHIARSALPARDRCMFRLMLYSGMRVGETAGLNKVNVINKYGRLRKQIRLKPHQNKGSKVCTVLLNTQARMELQSRISRCPGFPALPSPPSR